jgi:tetratricopeptide (TPR) repeat protein
MDDKAGKATYEAIKAALHGDWKKAVKINLKLIQEFPDDIETSLRLAKAYEELGKVNLAKKSCRHVLKLDRFNPIAKRNIRRLKTIKKKKNKNISTISQLDGDLFLEEPGKTKTIPLVRLAPPEELLKLDCAQSLKLQTGKRYITIRDEENQYLGRIPDDLSQRLIKLIKRGNQYQVVVKDVDKKKLYVFVKEIKRSPNNDGIPSFLAPGEQYHTFVPKQAID